MSCYPSGLEEELEDGELQESSPLPPTSTEQQPSNHPLFSTETNHFFSQDHPQRPISSRKGHHQQKRIPSPQETQDNIFSGLDSSYQVIQVISSLISQGFPLPWLQNPQIYQWLLEWVKQAKSLSDQVLPVVDNSVSLGLPSTSMIPPLPCNNNNNNNNNMMTSDNHHQWLSQYDKRFETSGTTTPNSLLPTPRKKKTRQYLKNNSKKKSRNWTYYRKQQQEERDEQMNTSESKDNLQQQEEKDTKYSLPEQPTPTSSDTVKKYSLEELRNQAKMALKGSIQGSLENNSHTKSQQEQTQSDCNQPTEQPKELVNNEDNKDKSSLVITLDDSSEGSNASEGERNTSQSKWSTLEALRRRVQELEQRKKQYYLQRRATSLKENRPQSSSWSALMKWRNSKDSSKQQYWQPFASEIRESPIVGDESPQHKNSDRIKEEKLLSKHLLQDESDTDETRAFMERLERETCKAWEEHDKSITEEIEARNKLIRIRTCEEAARESSRILKELLKKSRIDSQQYGTEAHSIEKQIEEIEIRRRRAFAMAEKSQRKLERIRRLIAIESLISKEETSTLPLSFQSNEKNFELSDSKKVVGDLWSPSPMTSRTLKPLMNTFRCYPLLHFVNDYNEIMTWYNDIQLETELCRYDLHGSCSDPDCKFQHADKYFSTKYLWKKIEKSFCTLFWLRYGKDPNEECLQLLHSEWKQVTFSCERIQEENILYWFQGPIQGIICKYLKEEEDVHSWTPYKMIPFKNNSNEEYDSMENNESVSCLEKEDYSSLKDSDLITQAKLLYNDNQVQQAIETCARGLEHFPHSISLWETYLTILLSHKNNIETWIERANRCCPCRNWYEWLRIEKERMEEQSLKKHTRYYHYGK